MGGPAYVGTRSYAEFDNFYPCKFEYMGMKWISSEQLYQALKFKDNKYQKQINAESCPHKIWAMGQNRKYELIDDFENKKAELMYIANREKFSQNPQLKALLLSTGDEPIRSSGSHGFWNAKNAEILMRLRRELR